MGRLFTQPLTGSAAMAVCLATLLVAWRQGISRATLLHPRDLVLVGALVAGVVVAQRFPIHVRENAKVSMTEIPLYLLAALLTPPLAATAAFCGLLVGELSVRKQRGGYYSDVASQVGRFTVVVYLGSLVAHAPSPNAVTSCFLLLGTGLVMWAGDLLTGPMVFCPITGESPRTVIVGMAREAGLVEAGQYLVGMLGAVAAAQQAWTLVLLVLPAAMIYLTGKRNKELQDTTRTLLVHMADTVDLRDPYTGGHSRRVTEYVAATLQEMGKQGPDIDLIVAAARVHDIGKIGMPDRVLLKDGRLTDDEWEIMKLHPEQGADLLLRNPNFARGAEIVRHHHERWDGQGYPHRLRGAEIPFGARVIAVADSYDAMTSDRPYRRGMSPERAAGILREGRGAQWEGDIVDAFLRTITDRLEHPAPVLRLVKPATMIAETA